VQRARQEQARTRRRRWLAIGGGAVVVIAAAVAIPLATGGGAGSTGSGAGASSSPRLQVAALSTLGTLRPAPAAGANGSEGVPVPSAAPLASTATIATGQKVDGISCDTNEQLVFHIHAHLTIMVNGTPRQVPAGIGIPGAVATQTSAGPFIQSGNCFYWLHTHAPDGIIHIESPVQRTFTLGDFFDEWGQPLSATQVGTAKGHVTALYNGQVWTGSPRDIPLTAHAQIQLEVGTSLVSPETITFPNGL
jgi:hypothetical protein